MLVCDCLDAIICFSLACHALRDAWGVVTPKGIIEWVEDLGCRNKAWLVAVEFRLDGADQHLRALLIASSDGLSDSKLGPLRLGRVHVGSLSF